MKKNEALMLLCVLWVVLAVSAAMLIGRLDWASAAVMLVVVGWLGGLVSNDLGRNIYTRVRRDR